MQDVVIVAAAHTAVGSFQGLLANIPTPKLGAAVIRRLFEQVGFDAGQVDEVILGQVLTVGFGQSPVCQAVIKVGLPVDVPTMTLSKICGSNLKALYLGVQTIHCGDAEVIVAGGQENMSLAPYVMSGARIGLYTDRAKPVDSMIEGSLQNIFNDYHMGITAGNLAEKYDLTREEQDTFATASQQKATAAIGGGRLRNEITPIQVPQCRGEPLSFDTDEQPHTGTTTEALVEFKPALRKGSSVTTGNVFSLSDGVVTVLLMNVAKAKTLGLPALARVASYVSAGVDSTIMGTGPVSVTHRMLDKAGWSLKQPDLVEVNKIFTAQSLAVGRELGWDAARVSVNDGTIVLGHPIDVSGCRVLVALLHEMICRGAKKGLAALCIGGGQGVALILARD